MLYFKIYCVQRTTKFCSILYKIWKKKAQKLHKNY